MPGEKGASDSTDNLTCMTLDMHGGTLMGEVHIERPQMANRFKHRTFLMSDDSAAQKHSRIM